MAGLLFLSVIVIATCGLIYELIAGTSASYLLGDSVTQFSTIIGCYLFSMGIGSWLTRYIHHHFLTVFISVEILIGVIGGFSAFSFFLLFNYIDLFRVWLYSIVAIIGILVGVEIPLLLKILKEEFEFGDLISKVFTFDYIGALIASIVFPLVLVPYLGLVRSSLMFGLFNLAIAIWLLYYKKEPIKHENTLKAGSWLACVALMVSFIFAHPLLKMSESEQFSGNVIVSTASPYQKIVLTKNKNDLRLFLNGNLQFSSIDEYRYHEALVHPILANIINPKKVLIIGGGDGLAVREILKYPSIEAIQMIDLDKKMTDIFKHNEMLTQLNQHSLTSPKLNIQNTDAFIWLKQQTQTSTKYDAIIIDLPDPSNFSIGKLYTDKFYQLLHKISHANTKIVIQSTSPLAARKSFWCIHNTLKSVGFNTTAYHAYVPSFGEWGFIVGSYDEFQLANTKANLPKHLKFLTPESLDQLFYFPPDMSFVPTKIQRLDNQALIHYFDQEWSVYQSY